MHTALANNRDAISSITGLAEGRAGPEAAEKVRLALAFRCAT